MESLDDSSRAYLKVAHAVKENYDLRFLQNAVADALHDLIIYDCLIFADMGSATASINYLRNGCPDSFEIGTSPVSDFTDRDSPHSRSFSGNAQNLIERKLAENGMHSWLKAEIGSATSPHLVIYLGSVSEDHFDTGDSVVLEQFCAFLAPIFQLSIELEKSRRDQNDQKLLAEISRSISNHIHPRDLWFATAQQLSKAIPADRIVISRLIDGHFTFDQVLGVDVGVSADSWRGGRRWIPDDHAIHDRLEDMLDSPNPKKLYEHGLRTRLRSRIGPTEDPLGVIALLRKDDSGFTPREADLLEQISVLVAPIMANANEHQDVVDARNSFESAQQALDSATDMISIHDPDGNFVYVNDAFMHGTGYDREELIGKAPPIQDSRMPVGSMTGIWDNIKVGNRWEGTYTTSKKDGVEYTEHATVTPIVDDSGGIRGFVSIKRDISEHVAIDRLLANSQRQKDLLRALQHEINSPLAAVSFFSSKIKKGESPRPRIVEGLQSATSSLISNIEDLGTIIKNPDYGLSINRRQVTISPLIDSASSRLAYLAESKNLDINTSIEQDDVVHIDPERISQVISNLTTNAYRYSPEGSPVHFSLKSDQENVIFTCRNEGVGVSQAELESIIQPFVRGSSSANSSENGSGIGLALSEAIIRMHGGVMTVSSEPDEFFEVSVTIPRIP